MTALEHAPVFGICGYRGAGKTTVIVELVARLRARGLATLVIKHDAHGLLVDRPGKDTHRFFSAGADVLARDPAQTLYRSHMGDTGSLDALILRVRADYDVILVEGHKDTPLSRKLWLRRHARDRAPTRCRPLALDLGRDDDRVAAAWHWIEQALDAMVRSAPTLAGILIGGQSRRMGPNKHLLEWRGRTWLSRIVAAARQVADEVVLLGAGRVPRSATRMPRLPDVPGVGGPLAGIRSAVRWRPDACWLFLSCDTPLVTPAALRWLREQARPGIWAVQPRLKAGSPVQPLPGWYHARAAALLESARGPSGLADHPKTASPVVPAALLPAWWGCNTPADCNRLAAVTQARSTEPFPTGDDA